MFRAIYILIIFNFALVACGAKTTEVPTIESPAASTPSPLPTSTRAPSKPPATLTSTPVPPPDFGNLPDREAGDYSLVSWDDEQLWKILESDTPVFPKNEYGNSDYDFSAWASVRLTLMREMTARFPGSSHYSDVNSLVTYPETYSFLAIPVENTLGHFQAAFEAAINANPNIEITDDQLNSLLSGPLQINYLNAKVLPANNVLNDGKQSWILDIQNEISFGAAFALVGDPGNYRLLSPAKDWNIYWWSSQEVFTYDLNANGIPEIAVLEERWGTGFSHFCHNFLRVYEWNGSSFANLAPNLEIGINTDVGNCLPFDFVPGPNGTQAITAGHKYYSNCYIGDYQWVGNLIIQRRYEWNGISFEPVSDEILPLSASMPEGGELNKCALVWTNMAGVENDEAIKLLPKLLSITDPNLVSGFQEEYGPAYLDYFRFKLGTWYAMRGQRSQAVALLTQVRDNPANPDYDKASELAGAFLQGYLAGGAYAGCVAAGELLNLRDFAGLYLHHYYDTDKMREAWGFSDLFSREGYWTVIGGPSGSEDLFDLCSLAVAFRLVIQRQTFTSTANLTRWFDSQGIPYTGLYEGDADGDGQRDWITLLGTGRNQEFNLWVLLNKNGRIVPLWVANVDDAEGAITNIPTSWNSLSPNTHYGLYNVYQLPHLMVIFRVVSRGSTSLIEVVVINRSIYSVGGYYQGFTIRPSDIDYLKEIGAEEIYVLTEEEGWNANWSIFGWDPAANTVQKLSSSDDGLIQQIHIAEGLIFENTDASLYRAIEIIPQLMYNSDFLRLDDRLSSTRPQLRPYLQYLLGLAYEMIGDAPNAVRVYWKLWHDFPTHPFSYVAQQKLK